MKPKILCSISTRGRYETTLPLALNSIIMQTQLPDHLIIFDDNDHAKDLREIQMYLYLFKMMEEKGLSWEVRFGEKKGQHFNHQVANTMGYDWVWRLDDDTIAEPNVLANLCSKISPSVGGIAGSVLTPPFIKNINTTGQIELVDEQNPQWDYIKFEKAVDHLHCSFLYRAGVYDYNLALSRVAHREETLFTWGLKQRGYQLLLIPNTVTWHLKNKDGGIRTGVYEMFAADEQIFRNHLIFKEKTVVVLDCGMGDHIVFSKVLPFIQNAEVFSCYPEIVPGRSIAEAQFLFGDLSTFNIYRKMDQWKWTQSLEKAYRKLYGVDK